MGANEKQDLDSYSIINQGCMTNIKSVLRELAKVFGLPITRPDIGDNSNARDAIMSEKTLIVVDFYYSDPEVDFYDPRVSIFKWKDVKNCFPEVIKYERVLFSGCEVILRVSAPIVGHFTFKKL